MNIIEKIEIKHFRSFDGGKDQPKVKIDNLQDLNVFSGANDSGKSNVLRALNLFFNNEISPGVKFDRERDFSKIVAKRFDAEIELKKRKKRKLEASKSAEKVLQDLIGIENAEILDNTTLKNFRRSDVIVSIKLFFNNKDNQRGLPKKFWVSRVYSSKDNFNGGYQYQTDLKESKKSAQVTNFLNSFKFEYVPAIKDRQYFRYLFERLQSYLFESQDRKRENKFASSSKEFNDTLKSETNELFEKFFTSSGVKASFYIPSTLVDFFRTLSVTTENEVSLFDRGDGIQARFIPEILDEMSKGNKKNIIWGFEEPENSYEAKNIRKIRDDFLNKYSRDKQIFITSHTKEFLSAEKVYTKKELAIKNNKSLSKTKKEQELKSLGLRNSSSNISIYRVWKNKDTNFTSFVTRFDEKNKSWEDTCDDLGIVQEARIIEDLQETLSSQAIQIKESSLSNENKEKLIFELQHKLSFAIQENKDIKSRIEEYEKPILCVEDKYDEIYKIAYLKTKNIDFDKANLKQTFSQKSPFAIQRAEGANALAGKLRMNNTDGYENKKIIGLFDFDKKGSEQFYNLKKGNNWDSIIHGDRKSGYYKKRNNHQCFYGLLIPVPDRHEYLIDNIINGQFDSLVEIENLLSDEVLKSNKLATETNVRKDTYLKMQKDKKSKLADILINLDRQEFNDFIPLFSRLEELFNS